MPAIPQRNFRRDSTAAVGLLVIAITVYGALLLHVPLLTEARDFALRFGRDARLLDLWVPAGDDYRPLSWKLFHWQQQLFEFRSELFNLFQFTLLGLCAVAAYNHLRQLLGSRSASFAGSVLWLFSLPVAHAAFWQATQHDKLAFIFTVLALALSLNTIRPGRAYPVSVPTVVTLLLSLLAVSAKPVAFVLPAAFVAQAILFTEGRNRSDYLRSARIVLVPALFVTVYALIYIRQISGEWRTHILGGQQMDNALIYIRNIANIDYDGSLTLAVLLVCPVGMACVYALWRTSDNLRRALIYLLVLFAGSLCLLLRAEHAPSFYLLLPMFAFTGIVATLIASFRDAVGTSYRRIAAVTMAMVVIGLLSAYVARIAGPGRLHHWSIAARNLATGYGIIRDSVNPDQLDRISFVVPRDPDVYFYFFSDGAHRGIDPLLPSFLFGRPAKFPIEDERGQTGPENSAGKLLAVWSNELQLRELRLAGNTIYVSNTLAYNPGTVISFRKGGNSKKYQGSGWSFEEDWGTWTDGSEATIFLKFGEPYHVAMEMTIWSLPYLPDERTEQSVQVFANSQLIGNWTFRHGDSLMELHARVPADVLQSDYLKLTFLIPNARSPQSIGASADTRALGIMVEKLRLDAV